MEMYNRWFESNIQQKINKIKDPINRLDFLIKEKDHFISTNRNDAADQIIRRFDNLIEQERFKAQMNINNNTHRINTKNELTVSDWVIIFYYAYNAKALPFSLKKSASMNEFIKENEIETTFPYFKKLFYDMQNRINNADKSYPYKKIEKNLKFLKKYPGATQLAENDIYYLKTEDDIE
jgi:hypothetical protein